MAGYRTSQFGTGNDLTGLSTMFNSNDLFSDQGFMQYAGSQGLDVNSMSPYDLDNLATKFKSDDGVFNVDDVASASGLGDTGIGFNTQTLGAVTGLGNLGLGYLNYKDAHAQNKQSLKGAKFNLAEAQKESAATDKFRASYGV